MPRRRPASDDDAGQERGTEAPERVAEGLLELAELARRVAGELAGEIAEVARMASEALQDGGTLFFCGNGGSAADAQHLAAEYVVRLRERRRALPALALTVDTSVLTAAGNDLGFDQIFARQVEALGRSCDLLFLHSTTGDSENLLRAARAARARGMRTVALVAGSGGRLREEVDRALVVPTRSPLRAQEIHLAIGHGVCRLVEGELGGDSGETGDDTGTTDDER